MRKSLTHYPLGALAIAVVLISGCQGGGSSGEATSKADPNSTEMLDWPYGYLIKGDPEFNRLAPNYATLRPFTRDTALAIRTVSEAEGVDPPPTDQLQTFHVRVNTSMAVRFIVADSTGRGLITYEFAGLPVGSYTPVSKGWPLPQTEMTEGHRWVYVFFVGDRRFRQRFKFFLNDAQEFVHMP
ncbi:MAG: hypothetical protein IIA44_10500, partial [Acidobacteria bacterium]|nr:hypothetical protein [Acidobacteriota bacterium]